MGKSVHLYPDPWHFIPGEPATERDVTPGEAERLLAYTPPAYHRTPARGPDPAPDDEPSETQTPGDDPGVADSEG